MASWSCGASVLDLIFPHPETVSEIRFRNWYTARYAHHISMMGKRIELVLRLLGEFKAGSP